MVSHTGYHLVEMLPGGMFFTIDPQQHVLQQRWLMAMQLLYNPILGCIKNGVILYYLRLGSTQRHVRLSCYAFLFVNNSIMISIWFADLFQCTPLDYMFNGPLMDIAAQMAAGADNNGMVNGVLITGGHCIDNMAFVLITAGLTCLTDILVLAIPVTMLWGLQMKRQKKIMVGGVLCLGVL